MTQRLYYDDSFIREFEARVVSCAPANDRFEVVLDRTAFYPTSGGQPNDTGTLGDAKVLDVIDRAADHEIVHVTDRALTAGADVHGAIDWQRRFDHLQQHTGQHLLSAAFIDLSGVHTVSFHLGREASTIDLNTTNLTAAQIDAAERRTNEIIFDDRPIRIVYGTLEELSAAGIRKTVDREGILRAIEVEGFDRQPCGGTHASRTGQVGLIVVRKAEKLKGIWRVEFVCGWRAAKTSHADLAALTESARILSCAPPDLPSIVAKASEERQATHRSRQRLIEQLAELQARAFAAEIAAANGNTVHLICKVLDEPDLAYARSVATKFVAAPGRRALLATTGGHIIFAQSAGLDADMSALLREIISSEGGKGGGSRDFAQGSVADASRVSAVLERAKARFQ